MVNTYRHAQRAEADHVTELEHRIAKQRTLLNTAAEERKADAKKVEEHFAAIDERDKSEPQRMANIAIGVVNQFAQQQALQQAQPGAAKK